MVSFGARPRTWSDHDNCTKHGLLLTLFMSWSRLVYLERSWSDVDTVVMTWSRLVRVLVLGLTMLRGEAAVRNKLYGSVLVDTDYSHSRSNAAHVDRPRAK